MSVVPTSDEERQRHILSDKISKLVVKTLREYSGRGPTRAHTTYGRDSIHCVVGDSLTTSERTLTDAGYVDAVIMARKQLQDVIRPHLVAEVEKLIKRKVIAFMSDNHIDPDFAIESFILEPEPGDGGSGSASAAEQVPSTGT
jgi:uncharacterized protein YbcI